tara:strand:+ start:606 stop:914 length:309 start_codon:yes stop_codon:yes gene_type:complete
MKKEIKKQELPQYITELILKTVNEEYGSAKQVAAEIELSEIAQDNLSPVAWAELEEFCLKATIGEMVDQIWRIFFGDRPRQYYMINGECRLARPVLNKEGSK